VSILDINIYIRGTELTLMKKFNCLIFLLIAVLLSTSAQTKIDRQECNFFGQLHFKNGEAIVAIKATYHDLFRSDEDLIFKKLAKQKKLFYRDYFSRCCSGSAIAFTPENCSYEYSGTISKKVSVEPIKVGQTVYLTCIVFEGVESYKNEPYFVIDKISYKKEDIPKKEDTKPLVYIKSNYINIESGCSYFSDDADSLFRKLKCVLVITPRYLAFIQTADNKFIYYSYQKRVITEKGYVDTYKNDSSSFELEINRIINRRNNSSYRNGRLTLTINNIKIAFNVYGIDEEADKYNDPKY